MYIYADSNQQLSLSPKDYFQLTDELSEENYHFSLSEALIAVVEQVQCIVHVCVYTVYMFG